LVKGFPSGAAEVVAVSPTIKDNIYTIFCLTNRYILSSNA
jgi:hypothetical protein